jgi:transcriptional regulator with PAS, ATPase and Fis domain
MSGFLVSGHSGPLSSEESTSIQAIADALAGAGLRTVRLEDAEWAVIQNALAEHGGNRIRAARAMGISVRTLQRKLKALQSADPPLVLSSSEFLVGADGV